MKFYTYFRSLALVLSVLAFGQTSFAQGPPPFPGGTPPVIDYFLPTSGPVGTKVRLHGTGLVPTTKAFFNGTAVTQAGFSSDTLMTVIVPQGATTGKISVFNDDGSFVTAANFVVTARLAQIYGFTPPQGRIGDTVTIYGRYFSGYQAIRFNGALATYSHLYFDTVLRAVVPSGSTTGPIQIVGAINVVSSPTNFIVNGPPRIVSFSPSSGPVGAKVRLRGTGLSNPTQVKFGTVMATAFSSSGDTLLTVIVPPGATGSNRITVISGSGTGQSTAFFPITLPYASITSFSPGVGRQGDSVHIMGRYLTGFTAVRFNGARALVTVSRSDSEVVAVIPIGSTTGKITLTGPYNMATSPTDFVVGATPTITSIAPTGGPVGEKVRIRGRGFSGLTSVMFGSTMATAVFPSGDSLITAIVPVGAVTSRITVTAGSLSGTSAPYFVVTPRPYLMIAAFSPGSGSVGASVTITGKYFTGARIVRFNGMDASFVVNSDSVLTAVVPASATTGKITVVGLYNSVVTGANFTVTSPRGVARVGEESASVAGIFPNPASSRATLLLPDADLSHIYTLVGQSLDGRRVLQAAISGQDLAAGYPVELNLPTGIYVLTLAGPNGTEQRLRLTVNK